MTNETISLGNGESVSRGVFAQADGTWLAMTFTTSRTFKTEMGARRWLARVSSR
jgi:hypothetical protein